MRTYKVVYDTITSEGEEIPDQVWEQQAADALEAINGLLDVHRDDPEERVCRIVSFDWRQ